MSDEEEDTVTYVLEVKFNRTTKLPVFQRARLDGMRQDLPDGTPSEIAYDERGRINYLARRYQDLPHCEDGAAIVHIDADSGIHCSEQFYLHGQPCPKALGPKHVTRDSQTGDIIDEYYQETDLEALEIDVEQSADRTRISKIEPKP